MLNPARTRRDQISRRPLQPARPPDRRPRVSRSPARPAALQSAPVSKLNKKLKFEDAMQRLDAIVEAMESGEIGIEEVLERYEEAMTLKAHCQAILDEAELRIKRIQADAAGGVTVTPMDLPVGADTPPGDDDA